MLVVKLVVSMADQKVEKWVEKWVVMKADLLVVSTVGMTVAKRAET